MPDRQLLDHVPILGVVAGTFLLVLLAVELGFRLGRRRFNRPEHETEGPVGAMVGATLGLLALLMAFTFSLAASRFDARRMVLLDESNAIGTAYLRADLIPEPHRTAVRDLLREYVDMRLEAARSLDASRTLTRSAELHTLIWEHVAAVGRDNPGSITAGLFVQSINDVIDLHAKRAMLALRNRIPSSIWYVLYGIAIMSLGTMGYHAGLAGTRRSPGSLIVCAAFTAVMWLTLDLDRPQQGMFRVSQQPMIELRESMVEPAR